MNALLLTLVLAQVTPPAGVTIQNEGGTRTRVRNVNCVGSAIDCTAATGTGTLTVNPAVPRILDTGRAFIMCGPEGVEGTTGYLCSPQTGVGVTGTAATHTDTNGTYFLQLTSAATTDADAGLLANGAWTRPHMEPLFEGVFKTGAAITTMRIWAGMAENDIMGAAVAATGGDWLGYAAVGYQASYSANFQCCTSVRQSSGSCTDMGVAVATDTIYKVRVDMSAGNNVVCTVNGTSITKTSDLPSTAQNFRWTLKARTLAASARVIRVGAVHIDHDID